MPSLISLLCAVSVLFVLVHSSSPGFGRSPGHDAGIIARHVSHPIQRGIVSPSSSGAITKRKSWSQPHEARDLKADAKTRQAARAAALAAAKKRAAAKAAAAIAAAAPRPHPVPSNVPAPTSPAAGGDPYAAGSDFMSSALAQIAGRRRCGIDLACRRSLVVPTDATAFCLLGACTFRCNVGFYPSGQICAPAPSSCLSSQAPCRSVTGGWSTCDGAGQCVANCNTGQGFSLFENVLTHSLQCVAITVDPGNCGAFGHSCPPSYNGIGTSRCRAGRCTLFCPIGTSTYSPFGQANAFFCA